ncbi:MAG: formyltransferase family protein [Flavobacteriaceae bacterium]|nr:formyltransferase family protein [Flavobacteriaceae bacterium]
MRTVLLTSNSYRHQYIARCLAQNTQLQLIVTEEKSSKISDTSELKNKDREFQKKHFEKRDQSELKYFSKKGFPKEVLRLNIPHGDINSELNLEILKEMSPDFIVLFGTSIIKEDLLEAFPKKFINLHLGLSPWYRGSATNLFPLIFNEPQFVGATIHLATESIDEGGILHQIRPDITENDDLHDVGNKVILKAGKVLPLILKAYKEKKITPEKPDMKGKVYRIKDITPERLRQAYTNISEGMISDYLNNKKNIDFKYPIVSNIIE